MESCEQCGQNFSTIYSLNRHISEVHKAASRRIRPFHQKRMRTVQAIPCSEERQQDTLQNNPSVLSEMEAVSDEQIDGESVDAEQTDEESGDEPDRVPKKKSRLDVFDEEEASDSFAEYSENSSGDSDDCDSSSEYSSEDNDSDDGSDDVHNGEQEKVDEREEERRQLPHTKYSNWARWRCQDNGFYIFWKSQNRKPHVVEHRQWLKKLLDASGNAQKQLIKGASDSQLEAFREIAINIKYGRAAMHTRSHRFVLKHKAAITTLFLKDSSYGDLRRTLLAERDCLVPLLLLYALPSCIKSTDVVFRK